MPQIAKRVQAPLWVALLLLLTLAACGPGGAAENAPAADTATGAENESAADDTGAADTAASGSSESTNPPAEGDLAFTPATSPAAAGELRSRDWSEGAPEASVTIIEYGDFQ